MKYTKVTGLQADEVKGNFSGYFTGGLKGVASSIDSAANVTLTESMKAFPVMLCSMHTASKTLTLGLPDNQVMFVANVGASNAFTLKNVAGDTGTNLAAGKVALVIANATADKSYVYVLN